MRRTSTAARSSRATSSTRRRDAKILRVGERAHAQDDGRFTSATGIMPPTGAVSSTVVRPPSLKNACSAALFITRMLMRRLVGSSATCC